MTTFFETIAHINSKEGSASKLITGTATYKTQTHINSKEGSASKLITGTATYKTQSKKFIDFTYRLFPETAPEECENFNVGEVVFLAGKFYYDLATEKSAAGIVVTISKVLLYPKIVEKWKQVNFPQTRPLIIFSAVCESKMSKIDFCITEYKNEEIKNLNMKSNIYRCMSRKDLPHFFSVAYKHNLLRWAHLNIQLNKRYFITGVLDGFIVENDPPLTRLVVRATEIDYDTFSTHTTTTNIFHNSATKNQIIADDISHDLTDTLIQSKRKRNVSFSKPSSPNSIPKKPIKNQQMSITSVSSDDEENKSEIKEILPYPSTLTSQKASPKNISPQYPQQNISPQYLQQNISPQYLQQYPQYPQQYSQYQQYPFYENKSEIKEILPYPSTLTSQKASPKNISPQYPQQNISPQYLQQNISPQYLQQYPQYPQQYSQYQQYPFYGIPPNTFTPLQPHSIITPIQNPMQHYHEPQTPQPNAVIIDETPEAPKLKQTRKKRTPTKKEGKQPVKKNNNVQGIATNQLFRNENNKKVPSLTKYMSEVEEIIDTSDVE
ncbi:hypothetical protein Glove_94g39 [Diversispora epigaea]|uniref:Uncharacterized protein n=1 Tax=Diversispora epigaea TaxID=1348612 RepID=A0A397JFK0_9GLOM|nr:hypothetical protein Glove_94g39 [Diversispora epigaea]